MYIMYYSSKKIKGGFTLRNLANRAKYVLKGEDGASNVEIIVWISVVLILATVLYLFKDAIVGFLNKAIARIGGLEVN